MENDILKVSNKEKNVLRRLAVEYAEICANKNNEDKRELWRKHHQLEKTRIPILCSWHAISLITPFADSCICKQSMLRFIENTLRNRIYHATINDDFVFEPWITIPAIFKEHPVEINPLQYRDWFREGGLWGDKSCLKKNEPDTFTGSFKIEPIVKDVDDINQLSWVHHQVDYKKTAEIREIVQEAVGDTIGINMDTRPLYNFAWSGSDISTALAMFLGMNNLMLYVYEKPELVHALAKFMQEAILTTFDEAEKAGDWYPSEDTVTNVGMPYCKGMPDPTMKKGFKMKDLWYFTHAQEFTLMSPAMHEEFVLQYQIPIIEKFGLSSYGCCEDLSRKIDMLRQIKNLRKISVTPSADVAKCAEQIGTDYVLSWKPNPTYICNDFDEDKTRKYIRKGLKEAEGCIVDIMLKDVSTLQGDMSRLKKWTDIVREESEAFL